MKHLFLLDWLDVFSAIIHPSIVSTQSTVESVRLSAMG